MITNSSPWVFKSILTEQGDVAYASGAGIWVPLHHGNAGDVLTSGGHGANPAWAAPAAGGASGEHLVCVNCQSTDVPNSSNVVFFRSTVPANHLLTIYGAGIYPGATANHVVELYNATDTVSVYSTNSLWAHDAAGLATLAAAHDFYIRIKNTSGGTQPASHAWMMIGLSAV